MALAMRRKRSIFSVNGIIDQGGRTGIHDLLAEFWIHCQWIGLRENLNRKPWFLPWFLPSNIGVSG